MADIRIKPVDVRAGDIFRGRTIRAVWRTGGDVSFEYLGQEQEYLDPSIYVEVTRNPGSLMQMQAPRSSQESEISL